MTTINELKLACEQKEIAKNAAEELMNAERLKVQEQFVSRVKLFLKEDDAVIRCPKFDTDYRGIEFRCEVAFQLPNSDRTDFGSDFYFYFEDGTIKINSGTIGSYSLENTYQLKRNKVIYELTCVFGGQLKQLLSEIDVSEYKKLTSAYYEASSEHASAKKELRAAEEKKIDSELWCGNKFIYTEKASRYNRLSEASRWSNWNQDIFEIVKVTPKFIELEIKNVSIEGTCRTYSDKIRKEKLVNAVLEGIVKKVAA